VRLKDELDYNVASREDLVARLMANQAATQAILKGYNALKSYGVDMMKTKEWTDTTLLTDAAKLKPVSALPKMIEWATRLEHAIEALIRRKQFGVVE
jgi:hypothetical protein